MTGARTSGDDSRNAVPSMRLKPGPRLTDLESIAYYR